MAATASSLSQSGRPRSLTSRSTPLESPGPRWGGDGATGSARSVSRAHPQPSDFHGSLHEAGGASAMRRSLQELAQALQSSTPHGYNGRIHDPSVRRLPPGSLPPVQTSQTTQQQGQVGPLPPRQPRSLPTGGRSDLSDRQLHALEAGGGVVRLDETNLNGPPVGGLNDTPVNREHSSGIVQEVGDMGWLNMCNAVLALLFFLLLYVTGKAWARAVRSGDFGGVGISTCLLIMMMYACCRRRASDSSGMSNAERETQAAWIAGALEEMGGNGTQRAGSHSGSLHRLQRGVTDLKRAEFSYFVYEADGSLTQLSGAARPVAFAADGSSSSGDNKSSVTLSNPNFTSGRQASQAAARSGGSSSGSSSGSSGDIAAAAEKGFGSATVTKAEAGGTDKGAQGKDALGDSQNDCAICLGDYEAHEQLCRLPCGHLFHTECLFQWLDEHRNCPLCKHDLMCSSSDDDDVSNGSSRALDAFATFAAAAAEAEVQQQEAAAAAAATRGRRFHAVGSEPLPVAVVEPLSPVAPPQGEVSPQAPFR